MSYSTSKMGIYVFLCVQLHRYCDISYSAVLQIWHIAQSLVLYKN